MNGSGWRGRKVVDHSSRQPRADEHAHSQCYKSNESLGCSTQIIGSTAVDVDLPGYEEEVITDAVQNDTGVEHPYQRPIVAGCKERIARGPRGHPNKQHGFDAEPSEEPRHDQHEKDFRHLSKGHFAGGVCYVQFVQEWIRERVIKLKRYTNEERSGNEDSERGIPQQFQRFDAEYFTPRNAVLHSLWRCVWQHQ